MPPESLWLQYSVVGIVVLASGVIALAFYRLFRDLIAFVREQNKERESWMEGQDKKRTDERNAQRDWQADQDQLRDERWHEFLKTLQEEYIAQNGRNANALLNLEKRIAELLDKFDGHDRFVRESISAMRERTSK